jgi:hypothetical protein
LKKYLPLALAGLVGATMIAPSIAGAAMNHRMAYDSLPAKGTVTLPSVGAESSAFNQLGGEVILRSHNTIGHVKVEMVSFACQHGNWATGCSSKAGATFKAPITLNLYRYSKTNPATGETKPGRLITSVTRTFSIHYRPSSQSTTETKYMGKDGALHNGIGQVISFPVHRDLGSDVVWTVGYDTTTSGLHPLGVASPTNDLNVGLSPAVRVGLDRFPNSIMWDTRAASLSGGSPFVAGELNLDSHGWAGYVPAARFTQR